MESIDLLLAGIVHAATNFDLLMAIIGGVILGLLIGALPGLGPTAGVAILRPIVVGFDPTLAMSALAGVYYGAMFGGAITSILLGIPGDAPSVMTVLDGYPMAKQGKAGQALGMSIYASFFGGLVGLVGLTIMADVVSRYALLFGPAEMTALMVMSLALVSVLGGSDPIKNFLSLSIGRWVGMIGLDQIMGEPRFTFGTLTLLDGLDFSVIAVGMFGLGQMFQGLEEATVHSSTATYRYRSMMPRLRDLIVSRWALFWGSIIGFVVGVLPGVGATAATMLSYAAAKKTSKDPDRFGNGAVEGVAAPEAANNSASYANMVMLFTLGIPGSATTAVLLGGLLSVGLQPGPRMFQEHADFVWTLFGTFYIGNLALVFLTILFTPLLAAAIFVQRGYLYAIVMGIVFFGVYSISNSIDDIWIMLIFGALGYIMSKLNYPAAPAVLGVVLGPLLELGVRRTLIASQGDFSVFVERPISLFLLLVALLIFLMPVLVKYRKVKMG